MLIILKYSLYLAIFSLKYIIYLASLIFVSMQLMSLFDLSLADGALS